MLDQDVREHKPVDRKQHKPFQGRKINQQLPCHPHPPRYKPKHQPHHKQSLEIDTFRTLLSKRDRHKESQSKLEIKAHRRVQCQPREERATLKKQASKSRSRSKGLGKSKSVKILVKKSKSMARLEPRREGHRDERKSYSPPYHTKKQTSSTILSTQCKSHYNSKTTREMVSQLTTERDRHKPKQPKSIKKPKSDITKKNLNKTRKKSEKENIKLQPKSKPRRNMKKNKQVLISEQHSKVRREGEEWQSSINEDQFLYPRQQKPRCKNKRSNIVEIPKRKERLSLNANHPRKQVLKNKTQTEHEHYQSVKHELQNHAAIVIQKVFRGYLTRKYIRQCFQHNAAIKIQKVWRGYRARRKIMMKSQKQRLNIQSQRQNMYPSPQNHSTNKILEHQDYLLRSASDVKSSGGNMNYASILEEILSQESVSITMKKKIEFFLQKSQQQSFQEFDPLQDVRSPSARSSISSQLINNQIDSQRKFIQKMKKQKPKEPHIFLSPKQYSQGNLQPNLKDQFCSPQNRLSQSPPRSSTQLLIANLKNIQKIHRVRFQSRATHEKEQLNRMLIKNKLSPRTHEKKYKEVDLLLESQLEKFNESINQIVKNCIAYGQEQDQEYQDAMITPKKQLTQLQLPGSGEVSPHHQPIRGEEMSVEFREYYQKEIAEKEAEFEPFDTSYQFIEEYLISLIDYVRQYDGGGWVAKVLDSLHKSKSHEMDVIIRNSKLITENSEDEQEHSFRLPMYKYIDLQEPIVGDQIIQQFNSYFPKLQGQQLGAPSTIQQCFLKMIVESMNEALNALRPQSYPFVESKLSSVNMLKGLEKIPFECQSSQEQMHYQFVCAQALNKIFYWNRLEWGRVIRLSESQQNYLQNKLLLERELETSIVQIYAQQQWHYYEELVEIIGALGQEAFEEVILEEIAAIWGMVMEWNMKMGRMPINIQAPDNKEYYLP